MFNLKSIFTASALSLAMLHSIQATTLTPLQKYQRHEMSPATEVTHIVVKFKEGTRVRMGNHKLIMTALSTATTNKMPLGVDASVVTNDMNSVSQIAINSGYRIQRLFSQTESKLDSLKISGEAKTNKKLNSLNLYYRISMNAGSTFANAEYMLKKINAMSSVEICYAAPKPTIAISRTPVTPDYTAGQGYLRSPSQNGVNAESAWQVVGGRGKNVKVYDVEGAWQLNHEDFPTSVTNLRAHYNDQNWLDHGTAVLGMLGSKNNAAGITGLVSNATFGVSSFNAVGIAEAISSAATNAGAGGVILLEMQQGGGPATSPCTCSGVQCNLVPVEFFQANFDAIQTATANGVIVVEAAGNGEVNLDDSAYNGLFNRNVRDSGAILVGASLSTSSEPACFSNYGSRIDVHAWGENIPTTGYGDLFNTGVDHKYTSRFGGTSGASPIVTGSVASIQGVRLANGLPALNSIQMRNLLARTGTPQTINTARRIGPNPNIKASIDAFLVGLTRPADGSPLVGTSVNFSWNIPAGASNMRLYVGSRLGATDIYAANQGLVSTTTTVSPMPVDGRNIYVRLSDLQSGVWNSTDYVYSAAGISSPVNGVALTNSSATFKWRVPATSTNAYLYIGTSPGNNNLYSARQAVNSTGITINTLPTDGSLLYVTFWYYQNGWLNTTYTYTASN